MRKNIWLGLIVVLAFTTAVFAQSSKQQSTNNSTPRHEKLIYKAIDKYFKWQYASIKDGANQSVNLQPLVTLDDARDFFTHKQNQLEVMDYSNQLNTVKIKDQSFTLKFLSLAYTAPEVAIVEVEESYQRKYEYFDEPAEAEGIIHKIELRRSQNGWEIISDEVMNATDIAPMPSDKEQAMEEIRKASEERRAAEQQALIEAGINEEFLEQQRKELSQKGLNSQQIEDELPNIVNDRMKMPLATAELYTNRSYNRSAAIPYIDDWWYRRNPRWGNFPYNPRTDTGGDCTNWVSQIIFACGVPMDRAGSTQWYWDNMNPPRSSPPYNTRSASWSGVNEFFSYIQANSNGNGFNGPQGRWWEDESGRNQMETADIIQLHNGSRWYHTYGVYDGKWVSSRPRWCFWDWCTTWTYKIRITSHETDRHRDDLDFAAGSKRKRYIKIVGWRQ